MVFSLKSLMPDTPDRQDRWAAIGQIMGAQDRGEVADVSSFRDRIDVRAKEEKLRLQLEDPDLLSQFSPQQRQMLAQMPPAAAQALIAETLFAAKPDAVRGVEFNGNLVDPTDGRIITQGTPQPGYKQLTPEEISSRGLDPTKAWQVNPENGKIEPIGGALVNVNTGDAAGGPTVFWEAADKAFADQWITNNNVSVSDAASQAATIKGVLAQLENGEQLTGGVTGWMSDGLRTIFDPNAQDAKERVEQVVQRSLRETLGAQFTETEGARLIARAYNVRLTPAQNASRLRALFAQLEATANARADTMAYVNEMGTLRGYQGAQFAPSIDQFLAVMDDAAPEPRADAAVPGAVAAPGAPRVLTYNPATGGFDNPGGE
jgi:hypothetical protein